jgi:L-aminopeptidase/D-esterase-like protein
MVRSDANLLARKMPVCRRQRCRPLASAASFSRPCRDRQGWYAAISIVVVSALLFVCAVPFAGVPLAPVPAFVASYQSALVINDLITAVLLFSQFGVSRARARLLASGYLFTVIAVVTAGHDILPILLKDGHYTPVMLGVVSTLWCLSLAGAGRALVVEDDSMVRRYVVTQIDSLGYTASPNSPACCGWRLPVEAFGVADISGAGGSPGMRAHGRGLLKNLLTDISGVRVGHADDATIASGVTAIIFDAPAVASIDVRGGGPGTREESVLNLEGTVDAIDAITLSGGSALGLDAAGGVQAWLAEQGRGLRIRDAVIPIVPGAICFDLLNGGNKAWGRFPPYRDLGYAAARTAGPDVALGSVGAGLGATTANFKGGLGSASAQTEAGVAVAALAVVNAVGSVTVGDGPWFWAAPFETGNEFGGRGLPPSFTPDMLKARLKGGPEARASENTTLVVVVTDAVLTKPQARRLAMIAQTGMARAIYPVHAPLDGDVVFAAATCRKPIDPLFGLTELGMVAANTVARAIARGVHAATALPFPGALPAWSDRFV